MKRSHAVQIFLGVALAVGVVLYLLGFADAFAFLVGSAIALAFALASIAMILRGQKPWEMFRPALVGAIAVVFGSLLLSGLIRHLWETVPALLIFLAVVGLIVVVLLVRRARPKSTLGRSGGGKAVPIPKRWR